MSSTVAIVPVTGAAIDQHIPDLARLRIEVFRAWPYLYAGDPDYEADYLRTYRDAPGSIVVLALAAGTVVGAATALPLGSETTAVQAPFLAAGIDPAGVFYLGESVLLPAYRGRGIGVRFFAEREAHGRRLLGAQLRWFAFCAVERAPDDPRRPPDHMPLDGFWTRRGYHRRADLHTSFIWQELGETTQSAKPMVFWLKPAQVEATQRRDAPQ